MLKFPLGQVVVTALVNEQEDRWDLVRVIQRHEDGDWGELDDEDKQMNENALKNGSRLLSKYTLSSGNEVYVITEWDRSVTTILYPSEY